MRLHNFFIEQEIGDQKLIETDHSDLLNQWRNVLRLNTGSAVILMDNSGYEYQAHFVELTYLRAKLAIVSKVKNKFLAKNEIYLYQATIKPDKFEWILEKGTELGIKHFQPIFAHRSIIKRFNLIRAKKIIRESAEQSGRAILPTISEPESLEKVLLNLPAPAVVFDPSGTLLAESLHLIRGSASIFIGPEGGFTDVELELFKSRNIPIVSLGSQILRAETAAIAVASLLLL